MKHNVLNNGDGSLSENTWGYESVLKNSQGDAVLAFTEICLPTTVPQH